MWGGDIGNNIAHRLAVEEHEVIVIDPSSTTIKHITDTIDVMGVTGYAPHPDVLKQAGASKADIIIATTGSDEVNMATCQVAHVLFKVPTKIARIRSQAYKHARWNDMFASNALAIDGIISAETQIADMALQRHYLSGVFNARSFINQEVQVMAIRMTKNQAGEIAMQNLPLCLEKLSSKIVCIEREGSIISSPSTADFRLDDIVYVVSFTERAKQLLSHIGYSNGTNKAVIIGAGNTAIALAQRMYASGIKVSIIEHDESRANYAAANLRNHTTVFRGHALDPDILDETNVCKAGSIVALTNDDTANMLSCAMAKNLGCSQAISLISEERKIHNIMPALGIDSYMSRGSQAVSNILRYIRKGKVRNILDMAHGAAEIIEAEVTQHSPMVGKTVNEIQLSNNIKVIALYSKKHNSTLLHKLHDVIIGANDILVIFAMRHKIHRVEHLIRISPDYI